MRICKYCEGSKVLYEDNIVKVIKIKDKSIVLPKKHYTIFEQVPDEVFVKLTQVVNKVVKEMFSEYNGNNILINNGLGQEIAHFCIEIIPRKENDGKDLTWVGKELQPEEMKIAQISIKENLKNPQLESSRAMTESKENYMHTNLDRMP